jgi:CheY-like chemotaxis protein
MKKITILVVDDEPILLEVWKEFLVSFDCDPLHALNGSEAVDVIKQQSVDAIITDLKMPKENGFYLLEYLKNNNINIVTFVCSGARTKDLEKYEINKIIDKPFDMVSAVKEVKKAVLSSK